MVLGIGYAYVNFGGLAGDCGLYHGYVVGVAANGVGAQRSFMVPTQTEGAIWATNGALVDAHGNLYVDTGNGGSNATSFDDSNAILRLTPQLNLTSKWAPPNWQELSANDWDLGSAGPIFIPGTSLLFE